MGNGRDWRGLRRGTDPIAPPVFHTLPPVGQVPDGWGPAELTVQEVDLERRRYYYELGAERATSSRLRRELGDALDERDRALRENHHQSTLLDGAVRILTGSMPQLAMWAAEGLQYQGATTDKQAVLFEGEHLNITVSARGVITMIATACDLPDQSWIAVNGALSEDDQTNMIGRAQRIRIMASTQVDPVQLRAVLGGAPTVATQAAESTST